MDGLNMLDPYYLLLLGVSTVAYAVIGASIYVNFCLIRYFWRKFRGKRQ